MMTFLLFAPASTKWLARSKDRFVDIFKVDFVTFIVQSYLDTLSRYMFFFFCIGLPSLFVYKQSSSRFSWLFSHTAYYMHVFLLFVSDLFSCRWTCFFSFTSENANPIWRRAFSRKMFCLYDYFACFQNIMSKYITAQRYHCIQGRMGRLHRISTYEPRYR